MRGSILTVTIFLPLVGVAVLAIGRHTFGDREARWVALATAVLTFAVSLLILADFERGAQGYQLVEQAWWVQTFHLQYLVGVDGISLWLVLLTTFLFPVSILASWPITTNVRMYMAAMLALETAVLGSFLALDLLLFFLFFEAILVPMYLIIGGWGGERRVYAAVKFFLFTMAGSAFLLVGALFLYAKSGGQLGQGTFDLRQLQGVAASLPVATARWLFLAFFVAFAVKVPLFPLHTWLPDAHTEAPTAGSVLLAGVLLKVGTYGLIRFNLTLFPEASVHFRTFVSILAVIGIVYGAVCALIQSDVKRLVAYSSVSHLGFVVLGIFAFTMQGVTGGVLQMVNHGLATGALFLLVGMVYERTHTRQLSEMGGLAKVMPWLLGAFLFTVIASVGLPGLNSFVGEFLVVVGTFAVSHVLGSVAVIAVVLAAIYLLWSYQRLALGEVHEEHRHLPDLSGREVAVLAPVLALLLVLGIYPSLLTRTIDPASERVIAHVQPTQQTTDVGDAQFQAARVAPFAGGNQP
ncbi:MAG: NADH-quinone oxidoreductase subunit M [Actinomycetota bacterium]